MPPACPVDAYAPRYRRANHCVTYFRTCGTPAKVTLCSSSPTSLKSLTSPIAFACTIVGGLIGLCLNRPCRDWTKERSGRWSMNMAFTFSKCPQVHRNVKVLTSLQPSESVATGTSKMKGRVSKWLRSQSAAAGDERLLSRGYFASTTGTSTAATVGAYLERQGEHHGYSSPRYHGHSLQAIHQQWRTRSD